VAETNSGISEARFFSSLLSVVCGPAASLFATLFPSDCRFRAILLSNISRFPVGKNLCLGFVLLPRVFAEFVGSGW
jgi:hypothetical protein